MFPGLHSNCRSFRRRRQSICNQYFLIGQLTIVAVAVGMLTNEILAFTIKINKQSSTYNLSPKTITLHPSFFIENGLWGQEYFLCRVSHSICSTVFRRETNLFVYAPPGSGYQSIEDEQSALPSSYQPMMAFPGTMRPGTTPENMPFEDLPIADSDPDPVPWPHFQQHEWHSTIFNQYPPHDHPIPMEEFIELQGRWATPEMEAKMRAGIRRDVRQRAEQAQATNRDTVITDDDDDYDDDFDDKKAAIALEDGMFGKLGSDADKALTAAATLAPDPSKAKRDDDMVMFDEDEDIDDFLLDLGLDVDTEQEGIKISDETEGSNKPDTIISLSSKKQVSERRNVVVDDENDDDLDDVDELIDPMALGTLGLDEDDDDDLIETDGDGGVNTVPLEDFGDNDSIDGMEDNFFDEGGFDFEDSYGDSNDMW
jgi:hypothetical protein